MYHLHLLYSYFRSINQTVAFSKITNIFQIHSVHKSIWVLSSKDIHFSLLPLTTLVPATILSLAKLLQLPADWFPASVLALSPTFQSVLNTAVREIILNVRSHPSCAQNPPVASAFIPSKSESVDSGL